MSEVEQQRRSQRSTLGGGSLKALLRRPFNDAFCRLKKKTQFSTSHAIPSSGDGCLRSEIPISRKAGCRLRQIRSSGGGCLRNEIPISRKAGCRLRQIRSSRLQSGRFLKFARLRHFHSLG
ncbi:hypothetical protein M5K25_011581 [Dendrobium thyrsiflorum]|uniref:Uncharacterized protein n=1 Tax=Dendrobium thyrsiflorum TaxID=117978 RepID=A0ABD0V3E8_DENTH